ncbi:hypothetical protein VTK56DRAFT_8793 [Thermocarpiscus australiensis]
MPQQVFSEGSTTADGHAIVPTLPWLHGEYSYVLQAACRDAIAPLVTTADSAECRQGSARLQPVWGQQEQETEIVVPAKQQRI